jgi:hypothetical protein
MATADAGTLANFFKTNDTTAPWFLAVLPAPRARPVISKQSKE